MNVEKWARAEVGKLDVKIGKLKGELSQLEELRVIFVSMLPRKEVLK